MAVEPNDPTTWPGDTIVVRCGSIQGVHELSARLSRDGSWSVFTGLGVSLSELARSCRNNQVRRATVGAVLSAGGSLRLPAGPPYHCDLYGLTPQQFDAILSVPEPNPVPKPIGGSRHDTLQADFNHMDAQGRPRLDDLRMHSETPFAEIAAKRGVDHLCRR
jgi:hypothetical protein